MEEAPQWKENMNLVDTSFSGMEEDNKEYVHICLDCCLAKLQTPVTTSKKFTEHKSHWRDISKEIFNTLGGIKTIKVMAKSIYK